MRALGSPALRSVPKMTATFSLIGMLDGSHCVTAEPNSWTIVNRASRSEGDNGCFRSQRLVNQACVSEARSSPRSNNLNLTRSRAVFLGSEPTKKGDEAST